MSRPVKQFYEFDRFRLDTVKRTLLREGEPVPLMPKAFDTLLALVQNSGRVLEKDELMQTLWPDTIVEENNLTQNISALRKALGESPTEHRYIVTIPGRGYRFVANVKEVGEEGAELILEEHTSSRAVIEEEETQTSDLRLQTSDLVSPSHRRSIVPMPSRLIVVLLVGLIASLIYVWHSSQTKPPETGVAVRSIAVLPFKPLSTDGSDEHLGLGMADTLITKLSNLRQLVVRPTSAVRKYTSPEQDPVAAGREQKVEAVLEGSIQRSGEKIRVTVRLLKVRDGRPLWAYQCSEQQCTDLFAVQDSISEEVAQALLLALTGEEKKRLTKHYTENAEAYEAYLKGRYFWNKRTAEGFQKAIDYFQKAIDIDPNYALAYAGLADSYILMKIFNYPQTGETLQGLEAKARAAAERSLEIDDTLAEAHTSLGLIGGIEREYKRAIELNPNYATAHHWYALYLSDRGRFDEAIAEIRRAQEIDPLSLVINSDIGIVYIAGRQYDQAIEHFKKAIEMDPNYPDAHAMLGWAYVLKGMYDEGIPEFQKAGALFGGAIVPIGLIYAHGISGNKREALKLLAKLKRLTKQDHTQIRWAHWVLIHIGLGEKDKAFEALERAYREGENIKPMLNAPASDPLRSDPRFTDLLRRVGLAP
jgi:DNA-binding winged helix-turn-helix (wHTH) protein/TolB-like protein